MHRTQFGIFTLVVVLFVVGIVCLAAWLNGYAITWRLLLVPALAGLGGSAALWQWGWRPVSQNNDASLPEQVGESQSQAIPPAEAAPFGKETPQETTDVLSIFLNNVGHELRTPLSVILGYAEIIEQDANNDANDDMARLAQKIKLYTKHLSAVVNDLFYITEIQSGDVKFLLEAFTVAHVVNQAVKQVQAFLDANENELLLLVPPDAGMMMADREKVRVILVNLLSNAAKFTQNGTVTLCVYRQAVAEEECVFFQVSDTGMGIAPEEQEAIFEPFQQVDGTFTRQHGGLGLGLAISRHYCQMMGGTLKLESKPGEGSTFTACLPAEVTAVAAMYVHNPTIMKKPEARITS